MNISRDSLVGWTSENCTNTIHMKNQLFFSANDKKFCTCVLTSKDKGFNGAYLPV